MVLAALLARVLVLVLFLERPHHLMLTVHEHQYQAQHFTTLHERMFQPVMASQSMQAQGVMLGKQHLGHPASQHQDQSMLGQ